MTPEKKTIKTFYRSRLPHIVPIGATFFVTFRLADSLPRPIVFQLKREMDRQIELLKANKGSGYKEKINV